MKKLTLPIFKGDMPSTKCLSMDKYLEFVAFNLKYTVDKKTVRKQKQLAMVNVAFSLKG